VETDRNMTREADPARRPLVSVIVPSYNYAHFITQTLDCISAQTYKNWECIIVDDGSTDNTREVVESYLAADPRFQYVSQKNQGLAAARNTGITRSRGIFLQFLDSDDLIEEKKLDLQVAYLMHHPEIDIVYGSSRSFRAEDVGDRPYATWGEPMTDQPKLSGRGRDALLPLLRMTFVPHAPLLRKTVVDSVGTFNAEFNPNEDWHFWIRCYMNNQMFQYKNLEGTVALYRRHPTSMSADRVRMLKGLRKLRKEFRSILKDEEALQLNQQLAAAFEGYFGIDEVVAGRRSGGGWQLCRAGAMSGKGREKVKWFFCAGAALVCPRERFAHIVRTPVRQTLGGILRGAYPL